MNASVKLDTSEFHETMREYLTVTKSTLAEATNRRMFFLLARVFVLMAPQYAQKERNRIRAYLNEPVGDRRFDKRTGKKVGRARMLQRRHLIVQAKRRNAGEKGLYGQEMKDAAAKFSKAAIGSVGYLKSGVARAIKELRGSFTQFGRQEKMKLKAGQVRRSSREVEGNAALIKLAQEYGTSMDNVAIHKGSKAFVKKAVDSFSPEAVCDMGWKIKDGQENNVTNATSPAFRKAYDDETIEMKAYLEARLQADANAFMVPELRVAA